MSEDTIVVIDNGSCTIKAGLAGDDNPSALIPNAVGLKDYANLSDPETFERYARAHSNGELKVRHTISKGAVQNWEDMEELWEYVVRDQLHVNPEEASLLITEPVGTTRPARDKMAEILFEKLNFGGVSIATSPILPMYAAGRTTGIVLDVGETVTQAVPVWGGYPMTEAMHRVDVGGRDITQFLRKEQLNRQGTTTTSTSHEVFRMMKEKVCHVVPDYDAAFLSEGATSASSSFELPNGDKFEVGFEESIKCAEFLFNPNRFDDFNPNEGDEEKNGITQLLYKSIMKTNIDVRKDLYANIVLSGGSTLFPGFVERLEAELRALAPPASSVKINIMAHPGRKYYTWIGGSILASLASFPDMLITKGSWQDGSGRNALHK